MNTDKKKFFNIIDIVIAVAVISIVAVLVRMFFVEGNLLNFTKETVVTYTVVIENIDSENKDSIISGDSVSLINDYSNVGKVVEVSYDRTFAERYDETTKNTITHYYPDLYTARVKISARAKIKDNICYLNNSKLVPGNEVELIFPNYSAKGLITEIKEN